MQQCKESPGLYYDYISDAHLYCTEWKDVTYINLKIVDDNFNTVRKNAQMSADSCKYMNINFGLITQVV